MPTNKERLLYFGRHEYTVLAVQKVAHKGLISNTESQKSWHPWERFDLAKCEKSNGRKPADKLFDFPVYGGLFHGKTTFIYAFSEDAHYDWARGFVHCGDLASSIFPLYWLSLQHYCLLPYPCKVVICNIFFFLSCFFFSPRKIAEQNSRSKNGAQKKTLRTWLWS